MHEAAKYLKKREWSMGNGQCPDCCGVPASWYGHPLHMKTNSIGHEAACTLAAALRGLGESPLMKGDFTSAVEYEHYISDEGFYGVRPKTAEGCPRYKEQMARLSAIWQEANVARIECSKPPQGAFRSCAGCSGSGSVYAWRNGAMTLVPCEGCNRPNLNSTAPPAA